MKTRRVSSTRRVIGLVFSPHRSLLSTRRVLQHTLSVETRVRLFWVGFCRSQASQLLQLFSLSAQVRILFPFSQTNAACRYLPWTLSPSFSENLTRLSLHHSCSSSSLFFSLPIFLNPPSTFSESRCEIWTQLLDGVPRKKRASYKGSKSRAKRNKNHSTQDSRVVPHRGTN